MLQLLRTTVQAQDMTICSAMVRNTGQSLSRLIDNLEAGVLLIFSPQQQLTDDLKVLESMIWNKPQIRVILISESETKDDLVRIMRTGVREVLTLPIKKTELMDALRRVTAHHEKILRQTDSYVGQGKIIGFISCKGGSGSTFLATNIAYLMADEFNKLCAVVDLDLQYGDASYYMSQHESKNSISDLTQQIERLDTQLLASCLQSISPRLNLLAAPNEPGVALAITAGQLEKVLALANRMHEFVVLDLDSSIDAVMLKALDMADVIYVVMESSLPVVRNAKRMVKLFRSLGYSADKLRLIVNKYQEGEMIDLKNIEQVVGLKVHHTLPNQVQVVSEAFNLGKPLHLMHPQSGVIKALREITSDLLQTPVPKAQSWINRLIGKAA
jgi:pilus assembly protein CpaE